MHGMEQFLGQLEARRAVLVEERNNAYARRQAALDCKRERKARTFLPEERRVYAQAMQTIADCDENLVAIDQRIQHQKDELVRAGKGNATVERILRGGDGKQRVGASIFPTETLKRMHQAVLSHSSYRIEGRDFSTADPLLPAQLWPNVVGPQHENRILNRLPAYPLAAPSVEIVVHAGTSGAAGVVAEGALKPELVFETERVILQAEKLAAHVGVSWEVLQDWFNFVSYVQSELFRQVVDVENSNLLNGNGSGQLTGFRQTSGILSYAQGGTGTTPDGETPLDAIEASIAALRTGPALAEADLLVLNPVTWSAIRRSKDSLGRYLVQADPTQDQAESVWGVPVLTTTQQEPGVGLMLDTTKFGRVFVRQGLSLETGFANDDFVRNIRRFVAEERLVLAVERPPAVLELTGLPTS
ncbi:phage major capsid protein [Mycobacterium avium subsp. hominissuis]|nr:phage major capsid protein [Mycobacterium avium subsp. hominissuis]